MTSARSYTMLGCLAAAFAAMSATAGVEEADPLLQGKGLKLVGVVYVLEDTVEIRANARAMSEALGRLQSAQSELANRQQDLARTRAKVADLQQQETAAQNPPISNNTKEYLQQREADIAKKVAELARERRQIEESLPNEERKVRQAEGRVAELQGPYVRAMQAYERLYAVVLRRYEVLAKDVAVKGALRALNVGRKEKVVLGPVRDARQYREKLEVAARTILEEKGVKGKADRKGNQRFTIVGAST